MSDPIEVSVVIPCLDEAESVGLCVSTALEAMANAGLQGEVIVADNGSTDRSREIAAGCGARIVPVTERGYGAALMGGIAAARGEFVVMGDADGSYDFAEIPKFIAALRRGADLVQGCRLPRGGGRVLPGAMPFLHYWLGNPLFSLLARLWFGSPVNDIYCGLRAFRRQFQLDLRQRCTGMEFATEMILRAALFGARIAELPISLHPDGRRVQRPHLRTFRDGWRTLRLLLLYTPRWLYFLPGSTLVLVGLAGYAIALPGISIHAVHFDAHTLLLASLSILVGVQALLLFVVTKSFAISEGLLPPDPSLRRLLAAFELEKGLAVGSLLALSGTGLLVLAFAEWRSAAFGPLDYAHTMRQVIPGATLVALGVQIAFSSFLASLFNLPRR